MEFMGLAYSTQRLAGGEWIAQAWATGQIDSVKVQFEAEGATEGDALRALAVKLRKHARVPAGTPVVIKGWDLDTVRP